MVVSEERRSSALNTVNGRRRSGLRFAWDWFRSVVMALALFLVIRSFFVEAFKIPTGSMEGTLLVGDFLLGARAFPNCFAHAFDRRKLTQKPAVMRRRRRILS